MRSVTFADDKVVDLLNAKFVLVWNNHGEDFDRQVQAPQPKFSREELELYPEGGGGGNVRTLVSTPDGALLHYIEGWWRPERYVEELEFALTLDVKDAARSHELHLAEHQKAARALAVEHPAEMKREFVESAVRRRHAALGLQGNVHILAGGLVGRDIGTVLDEVRRQSMQKEFV